MAGASPSSVFFLDYDRQVNAQESLEREYLGLYRKLRGSGEHSMGEETRVNPLLAEVPEPQHELLNFRNLAQTHERRLLFRTIHGEDALAGGRLRVTCDPRGVFSAISSI